MKVSFLIAFTMALSVFSYAQENDSIVVQHPPILCMDESTPFPEDFKTVTQFELTFFNRWGQVLGQTTNVNGSFQDALKDHKVSNEFETVVYLIRYVNEEVEEKEIYGHYVLSNYCNCG